MSELHNSLKGGKVRKFSLELLLMGDCIKCLIRQAMPGSSLCRECSKGIDFRGFEEGYSFEEYQKKFLGNVSDVQSIVRADDELLLYELFKEYDFFRPNLRRVNGSYSHEYKKLADYFSNKFFTVLNDRIILVDSTLNSSIYYKEIKDDFLHFRGLINQTMWNLSRNFDYHGTGDINPLILFLKKILRSIDRDKDSEKDFNYSNYVDIAGNIFIPGSAMFFLELYSQLKDKNLLDYLQKEVERIGPENSRIFIQSPMILLIPWIHQRLGFELWKNAGYKGILEMATATGKTLIGMMAIEELCRRNDGGVCRIFAHSRAILNQWRREIIEKMGLIADMSRDYSTSLYCNGIEIHFNTLQSVYKRPYDFPTNLLIVDEVHHTAAHEFKKALTVENDWRMGLSAYLEGEIRKNILKKELGPIVYRFPLKEARRLGVLPEFEWQLHTVYLSTEEGKEFEDISSKIKKLFNFVSHDKYTIHQLKSDKNRVEDLYDFIKLSEIARYKKIQLPEEWDILQGLLLKRRWIIHRSRPKLDEAIKLAKFYSDHRKVIMFSMDIESCNLIAEKLGEFTDDVFVIHSDIQEDVNKLIIDFKKSTNGVLIGARMLDEGIDIPDAEIGINVSSSKTRLQLVQRIGRILRMKKGKKPVFHHFIALPEPGSYIEQEDNLAFLDDLSWVQDTALRMGINAELVKEEIPFKELRVDAEKMIHERYFKQKLPYLPGYGTFQIHNVLRLYTEEAIGKIIEELKSMDSDEEISDVQWSDIIRRAHGKEGLPMNLPGSWWILILGNRKSQQILEIIKRYVNS